MLRYVQLPRAMRCVSLLAALVVCVTPLAAQETATVIELSGQVSVLRDSTPVPLFVGSAVSPKQIVITGPDGYAKLQIADGSTFEVFPRARVTFRATFSWTELVEVWLGRIRVQIDHRKGPNNKSVSTPTALISVRGTVFDVVVEDEDDTTLVSVEEGLVDVQHLLRAGAPVRLHPGDSIRVFRNQPLAHVVDKTPAIRAVLNAAREALYDVMVRRTAGTGGTLPGGTTTTSSGDKPKPGTGTSTGTGTGDTTNAPGAPGAPTAPGPPPGTGGAN
jgi:hypothetical protein